MLPLVVVAAFAASIVAAAPQLAALRRDRVLAPSASGYIPPLPEVLENDDSLTSIDHAAKELEKRTVVSYNADAQAKARLRHKAKATPKPLKKVIGAQQQSPPDGYIPPPLEIKTADARPYVPIERPVVKRGVHMTPTSTQSTYTVVFPSPEATGVPITEQYQLVTTFLPTASCSSQQGKPTGEEHPASSNCQTSVVPTETAICATTLLPLGAERIVVSECSQFVTYTSRLGYELNPCATAAESQCTPIVQTLTTYSAAPWESITYGEAPTTGLEVVCSTGNVCSSSSFSITRPSPERNVMQPMNLRIGDNGAATVVKNNLPTITATAERYRHELRA